MLELMGEVLANAAEGGWSEALTFACELSKKENLLYAFEAALGAMPPGPWARRLDETRSIMAEGGSTWSRMTAFRSFLARRDGWRKPRGRRS